MSEREPGGKSQEELSVMEQQINEKTGISYDFRNEFSAIMSTFYTLEKEPKMAEKLFNKVILKVAEKSGKLMMRYEERCEKQGLEVLKIINDKNREGIAEIDRLVDECNAIFSNITSDNNLPTIQKITALKTQMVPLIESIQKIISGK
jgi:hypothetical protein